MTRFLFILLIFCGWHIRLVAQETVPVRCDSLLSILMASQLTGDLYEVAQAASVSQFFSVYWLKGDVELTHDRSVKDQYFKYNGYFDRLIWLLEDFRQVRLDKEPIRSFCLYDNKIPGKTYCFEKIGVREDQASDSSLVFAQILHRNHVSLYVQRKVVRSGSEERKSDRYIVDSFEKRNIYYFSGEGWISKGFIRINRKNITSVLPADNNELVKQMRSERQNRIRNEEELIRFTIWLNNRQKSRKEP